MAARWLDAQGYPDAAAALARAARSSLPGFWTERRVDVLRKLHDGAFPLDYPEEPWGTGAFLSNAADVIGGAAIFLMFLRGASLSSARGMAVRRALAVLLVAVEDAKREALESRGGRTDDLEGIPFGE